MVGLYSIVKFTAEYFLHPDYGVFGARTEYNKIHRKRVKKVRTTGDIGTSYQNPEQMSPDEEFVPEGDLWFKHIVDTCIWLLDITFMRWFLAVPAFYGDFEAMYWYAKSINHLLPEPVQPHLDWYFNRD